MAIEVTVGRFLCPSVRDVLRQMQFVGLDIEWIESSGVIERTFTIKGEPDAMERVRQYFRRIAQDMEREERERAAAEAAEKERRAARWGWLYRWIPGRG